MARHPGEPPTPPVATSGDALVAASVAGDRQALVQLLEFVGPGVRAGLRIDEAFRSQLDADDVMQTSYLEVFLRIEQLELRHVAGFRRWLATVAENNLRDALKALQRDKRPDPRQRLAGSSSDSTAALLDQLGAISHTPSRDAIAREAGELLREALLRLPASYRTAVQRLDLDGAPAAAVATEMQRSQGAVWMLRARAHDRLREILGPGSRMLGSHG